MVSGNMADILSLLSLFLVFTNSLFVAIAGNARVLVRVLVVTKFKNIVYNCNICNPSKEFK